MSMPKHKPVAYRIKQLFCASALAAGTLGMSPAFAQAPPPLVVADKPQVTPPKNDALLRALTPTPAKMLLNPPESDWLMWRRTYDAWGYSPLKQINADNVKNLTVAWSWAMTPGATETTPLVTTVCCSSITFSTRCRRLTPPTANCCGNTSATSPLKSRARTETSPPRPPWRWSMTS